MGTHMTDFARVRTRYSSDENSPMLASLVASPITALCPVRHTDCTSDMGSISVPPRGSPRRVVSIPSLPTMASTSTCSSPSRAKSK